ncbi:MAG TPA: response regulator [Mycobacteriales bacterium]|nr:response regulator [Mycobacteriales bacterium]
MSRVLVAEDEPDIRVLARLLLEMAGHDVVEAADGDAALDLLSIDDAIDVVLLDLRLPGRDGWQVMAELQTMPRATAVRVVVFSAQLEPRDYDRAAQSGAVAYLSKPFTEDALLAAVEG